MEIFKSKEFGDLRLIVVNGKEYFDAIPIAKTLGYSNPHDALMRHCQKEGVVFHEVGVETGKYKSGDSILS